MSVDTTVQVVMPQMGDSVTEGTVLEWHKAEGDSIEADETLVEISTDKVDAEVPAPTSGTVVRIFAAEGDTVTVGAVLAEIAPGDGAAAPSGSNGDAPAADAPSGDAAEAQTIEIVMPQMGESVTEGVVLEWHVEAGQTVAVDDTVIEISTDKVDAEVPAPAAGTISETLVAAGDTVTVGQVLARMTTSGAGASAGVATGGSPTPAARPSPQAAPGQLDESGNASPVARRAAAALGVALDAVAGSGRAGRIVKDDVLAAANGGSNGAKNGTAPAATPAGATVIKGGAAMLARYMDESRSIPTATSFRTLTVTTLDARRKQLKAAGLKVSFTHLIAYAIARAGHDQPVMAHHFAEIDGKPNRIDDGGVNLGLAVDVEKKDGSRTLMVPVIRHADKLDFKGFLDAYNALVDKARTNTLTADDLTGGNVTLTNPGGIGTVASVPRLMTGQGTIIATGSIAYPVGLGAIGELIGAEKVMSMTSTYDHRIIQGAESGRFLQRIELYLQGEDGFYEQVFADLGVTLPALPPKPQPNFAAPAAAAPAPTTAAATGDGVPSEELLQAVQAAVSLLKAHRTHGHLAARLDPLGSEPVGDSGLDPEPLGLTPELMAQLPARIMRMGVPGATFADALPHLRETYCGSIAYEIEHIASHRQRVWLREKIETGAFRSPLTNDEQKVLLRRLIAVDAFERFMHKAYLGQKQFSIEGLDMTVPMIDELVRLAATRGGREVVIGMAHRGRLNVLAHNLRRSYGSIFAEFEGVSTLDVITSIPDGGTGDVKYHHGARGSFEVAGGEEIVVRLESNPSHLEFVAPVATGATRAAQTTRQGPHAHQDTNAAFPIVLHGDAAFPGQGIVAETFNLQALDGYTVGGTIHLIQNNQVGFTTDPDDSRSTRWASDMAKGFDVPIIHVNADDVAACVSATRLAHAYRQEFGHDVVIDLIGYRRFGHNEADEPAYTQPEMYLTIRRHPTLPQLYSRQLVEAGVVSQDEVDAITNEIWQRLTEDHQELKARLAAATPVEQGTGEYKLDRTPSPEVATAVDADRLRRLNEDLLRVPDGFTVHPKLVRSLDQRRDALGADGGISWAHAEQLAFASLLQEGTPIRLTGQDAERGTFSQRHMVLHDPKTGQEYCPIQNLPEALAPMELHNSPLSEMAAMGFEYGYSQEGPETLVLWEGQFGDFANGAQVIIDQFIVSGLAKWGQSSRLTLLLPHAYEGSGPEHSSARLERFLQLAAEGNIRVAYPTTPAQYFHLLRRQAKIAKQRPLIVMTPKSLLRLPQASNRVEHLSDTQFFPVLAEPRVDDQQVTRLILCTGKVYYDLVGSEQRKDKPQIAVGRVELLYPFPQAQILELVARYPNLREVVWLQEEPRNMGARAHMSPRLMQILSRDLRFGYIGRPERASTAEGYPAAHAAEQRRIVETALDLERPVGMYPIKLPGER
ncbi:multifunctional oxoglutarate decarboxylase/oxoglutarate dehydrogenase thiamine pyrophosphate-binding subunit/dihydrolipoyllysine-residue succinyltransferase subunit [Conexibacter sp. CPCC 205706]|nr:multifunctional oxoglutarate decarboxylase/oxoglutarate dehydrogenase thiamine pyrophosphate-binding subunit/dihydrolipoyllysine-residue succinyltransferase subunit [Conexibacter sp. CPCC 205706]MDO8186231.1 multifunctional oxoglutarate decarboxylase/oxoglutarate dehydrogenase thiamine pyrophosphate-binding subunit/dihydrolipoyllysine-residue succinyltransferase subunit [Conexibacter sp. CPCC 205706]